MTPPNSTLRILEKANLAREIDAFLIDRRARALSPHTIKYYDEKLALFRAYLQAQGIKAVESITAPIVRRNDEERYGEYRTKRLVLGISDELPEGCGDERIERVRMVSEWCRNRGV